MLSKDAKSKIISTFGSSSADTGSCEVQVILLSARIKQISDHLKVAPKDFHSQRGLLMLIGQRRSLMRYLKNNDMKRFDVLSKKMKDQSFIQ
jgi:small subunit ribosomal protein S15